MLHVTTEDVKSPTSVAVRLNTTKPHGAVYYRHYTPTVSGIKDFPTDTTIVPTDAHKYITFNLYIHNELTHVSTNHVSIFRDIK